ncbi:MAG TPA: sugar ABC transporter permease [Candidatus Faecimorpha stercoravium]|nr:sugar ABC transporter permease [Candidatus Faecimorpha stercoravium]
MARDKSKKPRQTTLVQSVQREIYKNWSLYLLVAVPVIYLIIFKYIPMYGVQIAFRRYQPVYGIEGSPWVGLDYFEQFMTNYKFWDIIRNTLSISIYSLLTFPLSIILAVLLNYIPFRKFQKTVQLVSYAPHFISTVVMVSMILQFLDTRTGLVNALITALGGEAINFMGRKDLFYHIYVWSGVWQGVGYASIIYIAALAGVSPELHEAAIMDGATIMKRVWHIDLPSILPTVMIMFIMQCGTVMSVGYEKVYLMQNSMNLEVSEVIDTYVYKQGLTSTMPKYSYSTAVGLFVSIINVILLVTVNTIAKKASGSSLW